MNEKAAIQVLGRALRDSLGFLSAWQNHLDDQGRDVAAAAVERVHSEAVRALREHTIASIKAKDLKPGMWLSYSNERQSQRVVGVSTGRLDDMRVLVDYGNGGEPGTQFFGADELVLIDLLRQEGS